MTQVIVHPDAIEGGRVRFDLDETRHLARVLRLRPGALVDAADGAGRLFTVRLESVGPGAAWGTIVAERADARESPCAVTLAQAILKGERMTWIVQKATELGVARIVPIETARVVARSVPERAEFRRVRWQRVAREAVKQCGRGVVPPVDPPRRLEDLAGEVTRHDVAWLLWGGGGAPLAVAAREAKRPRRVLLLVGPEGGFAPDEMRAAEAAGVRVVGLGPRTLRADTAGLVALTLCQHIFGDLGAPERSRP